MEQGSWSDTVLDRMGLQLHHASTNPDVGYLRHPSGVVVVTLRQTHPAASKEIEAVEWDSLKNGRGFDRSKQKVSGKGKKGALQLMPETRICVIRCKDGSIHPIRSGIRATLIEVNERLKEQPTLIQTAPERHGYLAIVLPSVVNSDVSRTPKEFAQDEDEASEPPIKR